ncbi:MAG: phosphatidylserine/phosphatidylglycerophosphate/cardiolipin synthase family protein [Pseudobacteriovorax sp.]|nr:phosphatidylserine/phosphatidylglycerophosphate/cardiolipin synthase family protein [Pseudobacteriovorax sp.]
MLKTLLRCLAFSVVLTGCKLSDPASDSSPQSLGPNASLYDHIRASVVNNPKNQELSSVPLALLPTENNSNFAFLVQGEAIFNKAKEQISQAKYEVNIATYNWIVKDIYKDDDLDPAKAIFEGVATAVKNLTPLPSGQERKLLLKILVNQIRLFQGPNQSLAEVKRSIQRYLSPLDFDPNMIDIRIATYPHTKLGNLHDKMIIVDGKTLHTGGANVQSQNNFKPYQWMDLAVSMTGPIAAVGLYEFDKKWNRGSEIGIGKNWRYRCELVGATKELTCEVDGAKEVVNPGQRTYLRFLNFKSHPTGRVLALPQSCDLDDLSRARRLNSPQNAAWLTGMKQAKRSIKVLSPNIDAEHFISSVKSAAARGVKVSIMTSKGFNAGTIGVVGQTNREVFDNMKLSSAEAGSTLQGRWYVPIGMSSPPDGGVAKAMHAKLMILDDELVILGSGNQDRFAWYHSCEFNIAFDEPAATKEVVDFFDGVWKKGELVF